MAKREIPLALQMVKINVFNSITKTFEVKEYLAEQGLKLLAIGKTNGFYKPYIENETSGADSISGELKTEIVTSS